jgi:hypothetical protein
MEDIASPVKCPPLRCNTGPGRCIVWLRVLDSALPCRANPRGPLVLRPCQSSDSRPNPGPEFEVEDPVSLRMGARELAAERRKP